MVFPVIKAGRGVPATLYGSMIPTLKAIPYSLAFWPQYEVVAARTLQVASLINLAGNVVQSTRDTIISAAIDAVTDKADLVLGMYLIYCNGNPYLVMC